MIFADAQFDGYYEGSPKLRYMICGSRRTGTTFFGKDLWETDRLGKPFEYQLPECRWAITARMPHGISYWDFLQQTRTTPNGVFGFKEVSPQQYLLRNLVADKVIYLSRRDEVAQTVSLTMALQTDAFFSFQDRAREPVYDYEIMLGNFIHILDVKRQWEEIFAAEGIDPLRLVYEDLDWGSLLAVADFLGIGLIGTRVEVPRMERQHTDLNDAWAARFREELSANGCSVAA